MKPIDPTVSLPYVPLCDRSLPEKDQTRFLVQHPHPKKVAKLRDSLFQEKGLGKKASRAFMMGTFEHRLICLSLVGWENFKLNGKEVPFKKDQDGQCHEDNLSYLPTGVRSELANFVQGIEEEEED